MNPDVKQQWVAALRSGEYRQGKEYLCMEGEYCCLGVLCELAAKAGVVEVGEDADENVTTYGGRYDVPPQSVVRWAGLPDFNPSVWVSEDEQVELATLNDYRGYSFATLADLIEEQL